MNCFRHMISYHRVAIKFEKNVKSSFKTRWFSELSLCDFRERKWSCLSGKVTQLWRHCPGSIVGDSPTKIVHV